MGGLGEKEKERENKHHADSERKKTVRRLFMYAGCIVRRIPPPIYSVIIEKLEVTRGSHWENSARPKILSFAGLAEASAVKFQRQARRGTRSKNTVRDIYSH